LTSALPANTYSYQSLSITIRPVIRFSLLSPRPQLELVAVRHSQLKKHLIVTQTKRITPSIWKLYKHQSSPWPPQTP
jgi:hypothetical protein